MTEKRSNVWAFIIYPDDNLPNDYLSIINNWHIPCLLSPIHDLDLNGDETEKKKHIHLMLYFGVGANKSFKQVKLYSDQLNGSNPIIINCTNAMIRYFIHKDNPEKHQYDINDIMSFSGFEYKQAFENYTTDEELYSVIEDFIFTNCIFNYADLLNGLKEHNMFYECSFVRKHVNHFIHCLNGVYQKTIRNIDKQ